MNKLSKPLAILLTLMLLFGTVTPAVFAAPGDRYPYDQPGDKHYMTNTAVLERNGANNQSSKITVTRAQANAAFTSASVAVDGVKEAAWDAATAYPITNQFKADMSAASTTATTQGTVRLLWDGPVLYALVEVTGDSTKSDTTTPNWNAATFTPNSDGLFVFMDVFNDQWGLETDTQGVFFMGANPALTSATSYTGSPTSGIPSLGSFFNANHQDYSPRLKSLKSSGYTDGTGVNYTYEFALQIEGWGDAWNRDLKNGVKIGLELGIFDQGNSFTYWSKTQYNAGNEGGSNLPNSERVRNRDWGEVTLAGWDGAAQFAYSGWRADEDIRFWNSKSNPGGTGAADSGDNSLVWTPATKARFIDAKNIYKSIKDNPSFSRGFKEAAVLEVCQAFAGLRWANTKYPDPHDLPALNTLPSVWEFFNKTKGTGGMVTSAAEWAQRKQEILDLAQFYEYGYKPKLGEDYTISITTNGYDGTGKPSVVARVTPTNKNYTGGIAQDVTITITLPTAGLPEGQKAPVAFSGGFTAYGIADITFPNWGGDNRTDAGAWGNPNRSGTFYTIFPYSRNSTTADSSIEIANATAVSVYLDILQMAVTQNPLLDARIDPTRAVTKGFSINGKLAFVAAVFDERVKAVVAGGAGATGPANWRYNVQGQEYSFPSDSVFYNAGAESIVAHGTEGPGNSYRHNRVRETELFRHFLPYGHEYAHEDGSYGYGEYSRLPFDQASLVATLAPDRAIIIDTNLNDYNDGAVTDNMSLQVAKYVYNTLGVNSSNYVKFNSGNYVSSGDPHGAASATPEGHYLSDFFYGTTTLTTAEADRLNTDPYSLNVANGQTETPYDYYWGGFNTITGGTGGISGTDGWAFYTMTVPPEIVIKTQPAPNLTLLLGYAAGHSLSITAENKGASGTLSYQWYSNTTQSTTGGTLIDSATSSSYPIPTGLGEGEYFYYVVISSTNGAPDKTSDVVKVTVRPAFTDSSLKKVAINIQSGPVWAPVTTAYPGTPHPSEPLAYNIVIPYMASLDSLAATTFEAVANNPGATVGAPVKFDAGARWTITVTAEDGVTSTTYTIYVSAPFIPVTTISAVPSKLALGVDLKLNDSVFGTTTYSLGVVAPATASNKAVTWSLSDTTNASITTTTSGWTTTKALHLASTATEGTVVVLTATITNGASASTNYTQNFSITVVGTPVPVTDITGIPAQQKMGSPLTLTGVVSPANATNQTIVWTVKADGTTAPGAAIRNGNVLTVSGTGNVVVTATIFDGTTLTGMTPGTNYTKDFTIQMLSGGDYYLPTVAR